MTTKVEKSVLVDVPVATAYNQWTQFEEFPQFMDGVKKVTQLDNDELQWVAEILGVRRQWRARVLQQLPDRRVAWAAIEGATNAGAVSFEDVGGGQTSVRLELEYEPRGWLEGLGDKLHIVEKQAEADLERFKTFIESEGYATGAWRGSVNADETVKVPSVEDADASREDSGRAGPSATALAAGLTGGVAVAAAAATAGTRQADEPKAVVDSTSVVTDESITGGAGSTFPGEVDDQGLSPVTGGEAESDLRRDNTVGDELLGRSVPPTGRR